MLEKTPQQNHFLNKTHGILFLLNLFLNARDLEIKPIDK